MINRIIYSYKTAFGGISRPIWLLSAAMFINRCGTMVLPFLSLYLTEKLHFSISQTGTVLSFWGLGALLGTFLGGYLTDKLGPYKVQIFALLFSGFMFFVLLWLTSLVAICVGVFIFTAFSDTFRPANSAAIAQYSNAENRTRSYTLNRLAVNLGWSLGAGLGGSLAFYNYNLLFWVDGFTSILAGLFLIFFLKPSKQKYTAEIISETDSANNLSPYRDYLYLYFVFNVLLFAASFFLLFSIIPVYFKQIHGLNEIKIGALEAMNGIIIVALEMFLVFRLERTFRKPLIIAVGVFLTGFSYLIFNYFTFTGIVVISFLFSTFGEMLAMPFMQSISVARSNLKNRGKYLAVYAMCYSMAQIASPAIGSYVVANYGYNTLWNGAFGLCCLSASGFVGLRNRL